MSTTRASPKQIKMLQVLLVVVAMAAVQCAPRPQDAATNNIIMDSMTDEDGESLVASLILAVARDWDLGHEDATEFVRAVPAASMNGTSFGPTTHPINESGPISFSSSPKV